MDSKELLNRIYDKLFDNVGMSKHHVDLEHEAEISYQSVDNEKIEIEINNKKFIVTCKKVNNFQ